MKQSSQQSICEYQQHQKSPIIGICLRGNCVERSIFCQKCLNESHNKHENDCQNFEEVQQLLQEQIYNYGKQKDFIEDVFLDIKLTLQEVLDFIQQQILFIKDIKRTIIEKQYSAVEKDCSLVKKIYFNAVNNIQEILGLDSDVQVFTSKIIDIVIEYRNVKSFRQQEAETQQISDKQNSEIKSLDSDLDLIYPKHYEETNLQSQIQSQFVSHKQVQQSIDQLASQIKSDSMQESAILLDSSEEQIMDSLQNIQLSQIYFEQALELMQTQNLQGALEAINESIRLDQRKTEAIFAKVDILTTMKKFREIVEFCEQIPPEEVRENLLQIQKGEALLNLNEFNEAVKSFEQALQIKPLNLRALMGKVGCLLLMNKSSEALNDCQKLYQMHPHNIIPKYLEGYILERMSQPEKALQAYSEAIQIDPSNSDLYKMKANTLINLKRYNEAIIELDKGLNFNPLDFQIFLSKSTCLILQEKYQEAYKICENGLLLNPQNPGLLEQKEFLQQQLGQKPQK